MDNADDLRCMIALFVQRDTNSTGFAASVRKALKNQ